MDSLISMMLPMVGLGFWLAALPYIATAISAAGLGLSAYEQKKQRKEAKEAAKKQAAQDAWENLMSAAGGQGLARAKPIEAPPAYNLGPSVSNLGATTMSYAQKQAEADADRKAKAAEAIAKAESESIPSAEATARLAQSQGGQTLPAQILEKRPWASGIVREDADQKRAQELIAWNKVLENDPRNRSQVLINNQEIDEIMRRRAGGMGGGGAASGTNAPAFSYQF